MIKPKILKDIKYGIDENGNPMKLDEYFKNLKNQKNPNKKQIEEKNINGMKLEKVN